jgi:hypothetical protein
LLDAAEASGAYGLFSALWIFIGEADDIKERLLELLAGDNPCIQDYQPSGFAFELVSPPERSRRLEETGHGVAPRACENAFTPGRVVTLSFDICICQRTILNQ